MECGGAEVCRVAGSSYLIDTPEELNDGPRSGSTSWRYPS